MGFDLSPEAGRCSVALNHRIDDIGVGATPLQYANYFILRPKQLLNFSSTYRVKAHFNWDAPRVLHICDLVQYYGLSLG